ncbi:hypothetical protein KGF56_004437 [Candida oxycetoniae]|uniref:DUF1746 domain-containing protein n=1 Tax=Candida oxycetoniae TaxID=497107 RepID=A0AAI9STY5_9ASCO|nr:uncharacterized protein KGF56_004437 [Candida oxycetoniae]KAI3402763.2 hypothetical protein KGF56_004437 [Candida oxycetoniae]
MTHFQVNIEKELREFQNQKYPTVEETITNNSSVLYKRKKFFLNNLRESIQVIEIVLMVILYLRDLSFFKLLIRLSIHLSISHINPQIPTLHLSAQHKEAIIKISLRGIIFGNLFCIICHLIFGAYSHSVNTDAFLHGGITIQFIGERYPYSRFELIALDLCIFATQLVFHHLVGVVDDSKVLDTKPQVAAKRTQEESDAAESLDSSIDKTLIEEDGYNGNVFLLTIDLFSGIKKVMNYNVQIEAYRSRAGLV